MTRPAMHPVLGEVNLLRSPINMSAFPHPDRFTLPAPDPGEHGRLLLSELGYNDSQIDAMAAEGIVK